MEFLIIGGRYLRGREAHDWVFFRSGALLKGKSDPRAQGVNLTTTLTAIERNGRRP
jgi:hypothetical protein